MDVEKGSLVGFFASLSVEQQKRALEYIGNENFGDKKYSRQSSLADQISAIESGKVIPR